MNTMQKKSVIIALVIALLVAGGLYYRQALTDFVRVNDATPNEDARADYRELSDTVTYDVPGGNHTIRFSIFVDDAGNVQDFTALDTTDPSHQQKVNEFYMTLGPKIQGKKLSELEAVDKVGTSSLTTAAFNTALSNIKAQL